MKFKSELSRREVIKLMGAGAASLYLGACSRVSDNGGATGPDLAELQNADFLKSFGPFNRSLGDKVAAEFSGDQPHRAHEILWAKADYVNRIGGLPQVTEKADVVIVGGGLSGLMSAYFLRKHKPIVLEQADRFGGNSRGESWRGLDYSLATSYIGLPEEGGEVDEFFKEIGFGRNYRVHRGGDPVVIDGKKYENPWEHGTVPESKGQFLKLSEHFAAMMVEGSEIRYPNVPIEDEADREYVESLDRMTMKQYLENVLGEKLHPHVENVIEHYFWSAGASTIDEISAAGAVNFFAADFSAIAVATGGNGAITEAVLKKLLKTLPTANLRPSSLVFDVRVVNQGVQVTYQDRDGKNKSILAKKVIMSCPKFTLPSMIDDLEADRLQVISELQYHGYLVANVLVDAPLKDDFYDLYFPKSEAFAQSTLKQRASDQRATDVVYGNYKDPKSDKCILTVFRGFPYPARSELISKSAFERFHKEFTEQIHNEFLPGLGLSVDKVVDLRIARWGHPLPQPVVGLIADKKVDVLKRPIAERIFFAEQDNWMLPSFEVCFTEAKSTAADVSAQLA